MSHVAIIVRDTVQEEWGCIEAVTEGVFYRPIVEVIESSSLDAQSRPKIILARLAEDYQKYIPDAVKYCKKQVGKDYDSVFSLGEQAFYCSELIYFAFQEGAVFPLNRMTFKDPIMGETLAIWKEYFKKLGVRIPEGDWGINPGAMSRQPVYQQFYYLGQLDGMPYMPSK